MIGTVSDTTTIASARSLGKRFGDVTALDDIDFSLQENKIYGLLGRNGAGKTTLMQILTGQEFPTSGAVEVFGQAPHENARVLTDVCYVKESQKYPDDFKVRHVLASARHLFYDRLLADYAQHPRTVVLSTHLIDEVSDLIEHVILIDKGRIVLDEDAGALREGAVVVSGLAPLVAAFTSNKTVLHRESLGSHERATVQTTLSDAERDRAVDEGLCSSDRSRSVRPSSRSSATPAATSISAAASSPCSGLPSRSTCRP